MDTPNFLVVLAFVFGILMTSGTKEVDGADLSFTVVPSEVRRQGITQQNPCPGDVLNFVCILNGTSSSVRWRIDGTVVYTLVVAEDIGAMRDSVLGINTTLVNETLVTLQIRLAELGETTPIVNGSVIGCQDGGDVTGTRNETVTIIGTASSPMVSVHSNSLSRLIIDMTAPVYGRECVDSYRATAVVGGVTLGPTEQQVADPTQEMYSFTFESVDLCNNTFTNVTVVGVTDGMEGMATPVTDDNINRTAIITSTVLSTQVFTASGINFLLNWPVVDVGIAPSGFQVTCFVEDNPISCDVQGTAVTQRTVVIANDFIGANFTSSVNYSYEMCMSDSFSSSLRVASLIESGPEVIIEERAVQVRFNETVLDRSALQEFKVTFESNCTEFATMEYNTNFRITIPDIQSDDSQCQYTIQLKDGNSQPIGPPITGVFNSTGLPPPPTTTMAPGSSGNNGAAIGGGVGGAIAAVAAGTSVVIAVVVVSIVHKKKKGKGGGKRVDTGDGGEDNTDAKVDLATYADPNSIEHQQAPSGEEYALVDRGGKSKPEVSGALYQDPHTIQHQEAAGGDLYTVPDKPKKSSKKTKDQPSEDQLAQMYSVPDKSRKNQDKLTYADIDLPRGGAIPTQHQTEYSSLVN